MCVIVVGEGVDFMCDVIDVLVLFDLYVVVWMNGMFVVLCMWLVDFVVEFDCYCCGSLCCDLVVVELCVLGIYLFDEL